MFKIVVADSSCLIGLSKIGQLEVLRELFGEIRVPSAVYHEVVVKGAGKPGADAVKPRRSVFVKPTGTFTERRTSMTTDRTKKT